MNPEPENKSPPPLPRNVRLLGWASLVNDTASEMTFPLLPSFLKQLGGTTEHLGLLEGLADTVSGLLKLQSGRWSDRLSTRKSFVVGGYAFAAMVRPLAALATLPWHLVSLRVIDRFGKGLRSAPRDALLAESVPAERRGEAFGFHRAMDHLGAAIGPAIAAAFLYFYPGAIRSLFAISLIPALLVLPCVLMLRETKPAEPKIGPTNETKAALPRRFFLFLAAIALFALGNSSDAFLLQRCTDLGVPEYALPILWMAFHLVKSFGNSSTGKLVDRVGPLRPLCFGWIVYAIVYFLFGWTTNAWFGISLFFAYALFYALTEPAEKALVARLVPSDMKGRAFGWFHFTLGVMALPSNWIFGKIYAVGGAPQAFLFGSMCAIAAVSLASIVVRNPESDPQFH